MASVLFLRLRIHKNQRKKKKNFRLSVAACCPDCSPCLFSGCDGGSALFTLYENLPQSLALLFLLCRERQVTLGIERQEVGRDSEPEPGS